MTSNQIRYWELQESKRSNRAKETETNRSNLINEQLKSTELSEKKRSNLANEEITKRGQNLKFVGDFNKGIFSLFG